MIWHLFNGGSFACSWKVPTGEISQNKVSDCDVIHAEQKTANDNSAIIAFYRKNADIQMKDFTYQNIRVDEACSRLFSFAFDPEATGSIENFTFENIIVRGKVTNNQMSLSDSTKQSIKNISFKNCKIDDRSMNQDDFIFEGDSISEIKFLP